MSFEIFAPVPDPETTCNGTLLVAYQGGKNRNELIFEEVKNQALHMYRKSTFIDGSPHNNFTICEFVEMEKSSNAAIIVGILALLSLIHI